jgi:hypothetical protein
LFEGKNVNLKVVDNHDVSLLAEWWSDPRYMGEYQDARTLSSEEMRKELRLSILTGGSSVLSERMMERRLVTPMLG